MTDYLEELLNQEEQESEQTLQWTQTGRVVLAPAGNVRTGGAGLKPAAQQDREGPEARSEQAGQIIVREMERLSRAVVRARSREQGYSAQRQGGMSLPSVQYAPGISPAARAGAAVMDYAGLVDAAFERDARRYDGPLGLL